MNFKKYKYYFKKPRAEITKDIFSWLMLAGAISIAATSPFFITNLLKSSKRWRKYSKRKIWDGFYNLRRQGLIEFQKNNHQIYITLTEKGKVKAGWLQIDSLEIKKPKRWDKKWRIVIFDISQLKKLYRESFRGKLKELDFYPLQKSVWIHPFNCQAEIGLLKDFFGLSERELRLIVAESIGNDKEVRKFFKV
jgi:DNA-binding transcriptional regulator PaaX